MSLPHGKFFAGRSDAQIYLPAVHVCQLGIFSQHAIHQIIFDASVNRQLERLLNAAHEKATRRWLQY
jgi:hypothetical protein